MNIIKYIKNYCGMAIMLIAGTTVTLNSCTEKIDESDLYTFTGEMITDYLKNRPETYSSYVKLLEKVHPSKHSNSTMMALLSARGHYTCFAPTNEAIQTYLDTLYQNNEIASNLLDQIEDSLAEAIVFNSIIQNGDNEAIAATDFEEGALGTTNMNDRFITISYANDSTGATLIYVNTDSRIISSSEEKEIENGYVHTIDKVLSPSNASVADLVINAENTRLFGSILQMTGWDKKLQQYKDVEWEERWENDSKYFPGNTAQFGGFTSKVPEHRYIGYTVFVETDSVFIENGVTDLESLKSWVKAHANYDDDTNRGNSTSWDDDYTNDYNWLNQFVAYHLLPERLTYNHLVSFSNEYGCDAAALKSRTSTAFFVNVWEYWETMGVQRRSLKITGIRGNKMINRVSVYNKNTYKERTGEITEEMQGITISPTNGMLDNAALNGYYYPINKILVWDKDVPTKVLNERMRYDISALFPEYLTNNIRQYGHEDRTTNYIITYDYCDNIKNMTNSTFFTYLANTSYSGSAGSWMNYKIDEFNIQGTVDFTMKLPPVPYTGTYEIRYGINANNNRGMAQVYIGTNKDNLPAIGIPLDLRSASGCAPSATGWVDETSLSEDDINESDKAMRNLGFMKGPKYMQFASGKTGRDVSSDCIRKIIFRDQLEAGQTYWIRFKSVLSGTNWEFFYDYLELVPKSIYAGDEAEDKW